MTVHIPCGKTLGHGESCSIDNLCEQCREIERLRLEIELYEKAEMAKANLEIERTLLRDALNTISRRALEGK